MRPKDESDFRDLYAARAAALRRTAFLLCGDWHQAEDLVQTAFMKIHSAWHRLRDPGAAEAYLRKVLTREFLSEGRRHWARQQVSDISRLDRPARSGSHEERLVLLDALRKIPPRQRACLILRFWEDCSVAETARTLGCRQGTVKSQTARGLQALRGLLEDIETDGEWQSRPARVVYGLGQGSM